MRIVIISDTHGLHEELELPRGDVLIHCGDFCDGLHIDDGDIARIDRWFREQHFDEILCVGGNHDFAAQERQRNDVAVFENATILEDESVCIDGLTFYGAPWLDLSGWAYFLPHHQRQEKWDLIPDETDVLITHTPPYGILDKPRTGHSVGCPDLRSTLEDLSLRVHCFGHVHASYGRDDHDLTTFVNAALITGNSLGHSPIILDL